MPSTDYLFHIHVDSSKVGTGCILIQQFLLGKRIISSKPRIFDKAEWKMSTLHRELFGIVSAQQTYEHYSIGSPFHIPILWPQTDPFLWRRKRKLSHWFFWYQVIITKFQNLKIIWTPGSNLAFPDILSQNVTVKNYQKHQLQHKKKPRNIESTMNMALQQPIEFNTMIILTILATTSIQSIANKETTTRFSECTMMARIPRWLVLVTNFPTTIQSATDCFRLGRTINQFRRLCLP